MSSQVTALRPLLPPVDGATIAAALVAGVAADLTWEIWARLITPLWVGGPLEPAALVQSVFGLTSRPLAELVHLTVGLLLYPLGYLYVARPLARTIVPGMPWWLVAVCYGVGLWVFALYIMAHLIAGLPAFLDFIPLTWASLIGHLLFALVLARVLHWREAGA